MAGIDDDVVRNGIAIVVVDDDDDGLIAWRVVALVACVRDGCRVVIVVPLLMVDGIS